MSHYRAVIDALNPAQRAVMARLGVDDGSVLDGPVGIKIAKQLVRLGLLEHWTEDKTMPGWPPVRVQVPKYSMPIAVHIAWCGWCSDNLTEEELAEAEAAEPAQKEPDASAGTMMARRTRTHETRWTNGGTASALALPLLRGHQRGRESSATLPPVRRAPVAIRQPALACRQARRAQDEARDGRNAGAPDLGGHKAAML